MISPPPFCDTDVDIDRTFYFAESVLLPRYRGQGVGHRFFDRREDFARENGFTNICFCAVVRGDGHPEQPKTYSPLDPFWEKRGYAPLDGGDREIRVERRGSTVSNKKAAAILDAQPLNTAFKHSLYTLPLKQGVRGKGAGQSGISRTAWQH